MRVALGLPGLIRVAVLAALGLSLLLSGCASPGVQTAARAQARNWEWCDRVQQDHPTFLCFQR